MNQSTACVLQNDIDNKLIYHDTILDIYVRCSDIISECNKCSDRATCFECENGAVLEEKDICISKELVDNKSYFEDETTHKYVSCSIIPNCTKCNSITECTECQADFDLFNEKCQMKSTEVRNKSSSSKLSTGAIIGIVFGCIGFLLIVAGGIYFFLHRMKYNKMPKTESNFVAVEENVNNLNNEKQEVVNSNQDIGNSKKRSIHNV